MATKIYIDQGHNPVNPNAGSEGNGFREQDIVYEIGQLTAEQLRANGFDVRLSRPTESTQLGTSNGTSLRARVDEANSWGADYFISLHTNASVIEEATGSEAFVYQRLFRRSSRRKHTDTAELCNRPQKQRSCGASRVICSSQNKNASNAC